MGGGGGGLRIGVITFKSPSRYRTSLKDEMVRPNIVKIHCQNTFRPCNHDSDPLLIRLTKPLGLAILLQNSPYTSSQTNKLTYISRAKLDENWLKIIHTKLNYVQKKNVNPFSIQSSQETGGFIVLYDKDLINTQL